MDNKNSEKTQRPPVVVIMGHIDHGKSKLLDYIRNANVVEKEAGGITQHIGAYEAEVKCTAEHKHKARKITFLDTPGHEAFSQMRHRGAKIADVAVLVIAADEGPKPQSLEAFRSIKETGIPFIIALNKMDKPEAQPDRVKAQLTENEIFVENYGGNIPCVNISAKSGEGVEELLDMILLLADMEDLGASIDDPATGFVIESHLDPKRGISSTLLVLNGQLKKGQFVAVEDSIAPVRIFEDFKGKTIEEASFSSPVKIVGFDKLPTLGSKFSVFNSKKEAEVFAQNFKKESQEDQKNKQAESLVFDKAKIVIPLLIKADVFGSLEAVEKELKKLEGEDAILNILRKDIGNISEDDAKLVAGAVKPIIVGFNVKTENIARDLIEKHNIQVFLSDIIYKISDWLKEEIEKRRAENQTERIIGTAKILKTFSQNKNKQLVGGKVLSGKITMSQKYQVRVKRDDQEICQARITDMQQNKADVKEVEEGKEFGMILDARELVAGGDLVEVIEKLI